MIETPAVVNPSADPAFQVSAAESHEADQAVAEAIHGLASPVAPATLYQNGSVLMSAIENVGWKRPPVPAPTPSKRPYHCSGTRVMQERLAAKNAAAAAAALVPPAVAPKMAPLTPVRPAFEVALAPAIERYLNEDDVFITREMLRATPSKKSALRPSRGGYTPMLQRRAASPASSNKRRHSSASAESWQPAQEDFEEDFEEPILASPAKKAKTSLAENSSRAFMDTPSRRGRSGIGGGVPATHSAVPSPTLGLRAGSAMTLPTFFQGMVTMPQNPVVPASPAGTPLRDQIWFCTPGSSVPMCNKCLWHYGHSMDLSAGVVPPVCSLTTLPAQRVAITSCSRCRRRKAKCEKVGNSLEYHARFTC
jgi:hypothetical protein